MSTEELAWLAGLLEGEGCFCCSRPGRLRVQMTSTDRDVIERSARLVGANVLGPYPNGALGTKDIYKWYVNGERARILMEDLLPWMCSRRRESIMAVL